MAIDMPPMSLEQAQSFYEGPAYVQVVDENYGASGAVASALMAKQNAAQRARSQALLDTALGVGVKSGIAWQLNNIKKTIAENERALDTIYDFGGLMIQGRVVPPVIIETTDLYHQDGDYTVRLSGAYYKVEMQARFSSVAPSWRGYLSFPSDKGISASYDMIKPRGAEERDLWKLAVADGWSQGVEQANVMLEYALDRLNRDFVGMLRFHEFVLKGKVSMPIISSEYIPVVKDGATMTVDETLLRITTLSEFDADIDKWISITPSASAAGGEIAPWVKSSGSVVGSGVQEAQVYPITPSGNMR